jgi:chemotaxis signal transduction protein
VVGEPLQSTIEGGAARRLVCFKLRDQELAIPIAAVRETIRVRPITRVFLVPAWLIGIFSLRGEIVPAVDVATWFGMPPAVIGDESRLVVLRHPTKAFAILVDALLDLSTVAEETISGAPPTLAPEQAALLSGVAPSASGVVRIINAAALFESEWIESLTRLGQS